jgi:hypothetical protein
LITAGEHVWQLSEAGDNSLGLSCTAEGLFLGRTPLIERRGDGYFVRPRAELARLLGRAYGADIIPDRLMPGFAAVAGALGIKNLCLAQIAAVHLRLPHLPGTIERIGVEAEDMLIKLERVMEQFVRVAWDEAEHPRTGTPPNPGWFASRNGSSVGQAPTQVAANEREERKPDEELDPLAEVRQAQWEAGIATLRRIDPNNANLTYFANPGAVPNQAALDRLNAAIETAAVQRVTNKLMPGGRPIGLPGTSPRVRVLPGGIKGAQGLFDYLRVGGAVETSGSAITVVKPPGRAGPVTFRPNSTSGPPAVDVNIPGIPLRRIHFL